MEIFSFFLMACFLYLKPKSLSFIFFGNSYNKMKQNQKNMAIRFAIPGKSVCVWKAGEKMFDFTDHLYDTIAIDGLSTWEDFCKYKPHRVKAVGTCTGEIMYVHKDGKRNKHRYWLWHCEKCSRSGIVRADTLRRWTLDGHKCKCRHQQQALYNRSITGSAGRFKHCKACNRDLPANGNYWYVSKRGYLSFECIQCIRKRRINNYDYKHWTGKMRAEQRDTNYWRVR